MDLSQAFEIGKNIGFLRWAAFPAEDVFAVAAKPLVGSCGIRERPRVEDGCQRWNALASGGVFAWSGRRRTMARGAGPLAPMFRTEERFTATGVAGSSGLRVPQLQLLTEGRLGGVGEGTRARQQADDEDTLDLGEVFQ